MVDVSSKEVTQRKASALSRVCFPQTVWTALEESGFATSKGSIIDVAIIAGTTGVKQTANLIPFCHLLPIDSCKFATTTDPESCCIEFTCTVTCTGRTGVEMEALTGASVAALALYDMTKALGHDIVIEAVQLLSKSGGKKDFGSV
jgi:cyclic pyranopterin phosphate synthase